MRFRSVQTSSGSPRRLLAVVAIAGIGLAAGPVAAQSPTAQDAEFRANTYTTGNQRYQAVGASKGGDVVVAWTSDGQDGSSYGIYAQRYGPDGQPVGAEFRVNTTTSSFQAYPSVALGGDGSAVVAWQSLGQDGSGFGVYAQRYRSDGAPSGPEFRVNTTTEGSQAGPSVALDDDGDIVVAWSSEGQDGHGHGVYAQRYDATGAPLGPEFRVNTTTADVQAYPAVAMNAGGAFAVAWESHGQDGSGTGIYAQRYAASGAPEGSEFQVAAFTQGDQRYPSAAMDDAGDLVVVWSSDGQDGAEGGVYARRYTAGGPEGPEVRVNATTAGNQANPSVAMDAAGHAVVAWSSDGQDGNSYGVYAQRYGPDSQPEGPEFRVNTTTDSFQGFPAVALDAEGDLIVVWESLGQDGSEFGVYAQRYGAAPVTAAPILRAATPLAIAPNPVGRNGGQVSYELSGPAPVRLSLYDVLGREVAVVWDGEQAAGPHAVRLDVGHLVPGLYAVRLRVGDETVVRRMTIAR